AGLATAGAAHGAPAMTMDLGAAVSAGAPVPPGAPPRAVVGVRALARAASEGSLGSPGCFVGPRSLESFCPPGPPVAYSRPLGSGPKEKRLHRHRLSELRADGSDLRLASRPGALRTRGGGVQRRPGRYARTLES
ncbi:unnamed protein product, partial [Prorocentrum cordatum]